MVSSNYKQGYYEHSWPFFDPDLGTDFSSPYIVCPCKKRHQRDPPSLPPSPFSFFPLPPCLSPSTKERPSNKLASRSQEERELLPETKAASTLILHFPASRTMKNEFCFYCYLCLFIIKVTQSITFRCGTRS